MPELEGRKLNGSGRKLEMARVHELDRRQAALLRLCSNAVDYKCVQCNAAARFASTRVINPYTLTL